MFCETCGTVLNVDGQCVNCDKKQLERDLSTERRDNLSSEITG